MDYEIKTHTKMVYHQTFLIRTDQLSVVELEKLTERDSHLWNPVHCLEDHESMIVETKEFPNGERIAQDFYNDGKLVPKK